MKGMTFRKIAQKPLLFLNYFIFFNMVVLDFSFF